MPPRGEVRSLHHEIQSFPCPVSSLKAGLKPFFHRLIHPEYISKTTFSTPGVHFLSVACGSHLLGVITRQFQGQSWPWPLLGPRGLLSAVTSIQEGPKAELGMLHPSKTRSLLLGANQQLEFPLSLLLSQGDSRFLQLIAAFLKSQFVIISPRHTQVKYVTLPMTIVMSRFFFLFPQ